MGQSWGAALGLQVAKRRPELFYVFVGCGQPVSLERSLLILAMKRLEKEGYVNKRTSAGQSWYSLAQ